MLKFLKQFLIYGFASVLGKIAAVFLLPFYTNILSQEEYGAMAIIVAAKGIIDLVSNLNIHSGVARDYYEKTVDRIKLISTGFISILFFSICVLIILYTSRIYWITNILNVPDYKEAYVVMLLTIPAGSLFSYFGILTRYKQKAGYFSIGTVIQLIIQISLTIYFVLVLKSGIVGVFYGILGGEFIGIIYFYYLNREYVSISFDWGLLKRVLTFSLPTLPAILAGWADSSVGQILIGKYISVSDAGIYSIALMFASVYLIIKNALGNVWNPYVYENYNRSGFRESVLKLYKAATLVLIIISVNLALLSDYIVVLLSTREYIEASNYLVILTIPMSISILEWFVAVGPGINRRTKYISYANITGSIANLILLIVFLPKYGVITVPLSFAISRIISYALSSYYTYSQISLNFPIKYLLILITSVSFCYFIKNYKINELIIFFLLGGINLLFIIYIYNKYNLSYYIIKNKSK